MPALISPRAPPGVGYTAAMRIVWLVTLAALGACTETRELPILTIDVGVDSAFADDATACDAEPCPPENGGGVVLDGCTALRETADERWLLVSEEVPLGDVRGALKLAHIGPDAFVISLIDANSHGAIGRRTDALIAGQVVDVVAAHDPALVLYRVDDGAVITSAVADVAAADDMTFTYTVGDVVVTERHQVTGRDPAVVSVRHVNEYDCACSSVGPGGAVQAVCLLGVVGLVRRRRRR
jgi:hypothetical protein